MNSSDLASYGSYSRKRYTLNLLPMCLEGVPPNYIEGKFPRPPSIPSSIHLDRLLIAQLYTYNLAEILKNCAKFIQKLAPGFKNHMRDLGNCRKAVESSKSWNSMGYFCPKNTSLQEKHFMQRIYVPYFQLLVHQIPKFLMSFLKP